MRKFHLLKIMICVLLVLLFSLIQTAARDEHRKLTEYLPPNCNPSFHNHDAIQASVAFANKHLTSTVETRKNRLPVMILFSQGLEPSAQVHNRLKYLKCSLRKLIKNLPGTSLDIFIWVPESSLQHIPEWFKADSFPNTVFIPIVDITWRVPCGLSDDALWAVRNKFDLDYYLMGRWRLTFSLDFAQAMGYKYHLQFDDDAMINNIISYDIVSRARNETKDMVVFSDIYGDNPSVLSGLPELTRYWLYVRKFSIQGPLLDHVKPRGDINGLTTDGWDRLYHPGYFVILSVDFWFSDVVQDFLKTVLRSGRDVEGRWQEQGVQNMMRLLFIPSTRLWVMEDIDIGHDRHKPASFEKWCVKSGVMTD